MSDDLLNGYNHFVDTLLSHPSKHLSTLIARMRVLEETGINVARLLTASDGLCSESGELKEIVKKALYQGKPLDDATQHHIKRELGDVIFYWFVACQALNITAVDVINENISKLEARYPGGKFEITHSETRKLGDL